MLKDQRGQIFLVVLLVMVITMTVGLSVASRNIVSLRTSREERDSQRALAAAEAGIEQSLKSGSGITATSFSGDPGTSYSTSVSQVSGTQFLVHGGNEVLKDEGTDIWLVPHDANNDPDYSTSWNGSLRIYWGDSSGSCNNGAMEVTVVSGSAVTPIMTRRVYDPCAARRNLNNFTVSSGGGTVRGRLFTFSTPSISISSGFLVRVVPIYVDTDIGSTASIAVPSQGDIIDATGQSSDTSRKIKVFRGYPSLPSQFFSYGLFSP
jgi:hypothetical protein